MSYSFRNLWSDEEGQDIAEYSVMLAVILVIVVGTVRLIGSNAATSFRRWVARCSKPEPLAPVSNANYWPAALSSLLATFTPLNPSTYFAIPR